MTKQEAIVISAYTGVLMCDFADMHEYIERIIERPVFTHELADKNLCEQIKERAKSDFMAICESVSKYG